MQLGIFAKVFERNNLSDALAAAVSYDFKILHFNMACAGLESMPEHISDESISNITSSLEKYKICLCGISATFNLIHPDPAELERGIRRFRVLASKARRLGSDFLSLCTGTRNLQSMWEFHPDNNSTEAWSDLVRNMSKLVEVAEEFDLRLGIEPETNNVVNSAEKALRLLKEMGSKRLQIIMDPSNLFYVSDLANMDNIIQQAFDMLGHYIALAHAKDIVWDRSKNRIRHCAAGKGMLNYDLYLRLLNKIGYTSPLILHSLHENEILESARYLKRMKDDGVFKFTKYPHSL